MAIDFSVQSQTMQFAQTSSAHGGTTQTGSLMGHAATQLASPMSLLADAAEELTFSVDSTDDFELEERKERKSVEESTAERVELYKELMGQVGKSQDIELLKKNLRTCKDKDEALQEARRFFSDPSDAWVALSDALAEQEKEPSANAESIAAIKGALATLEAEEGDRIQSGIQGALSAASFSEKDALGGVESLRGLYRDTVCDFTSVEDAFQHLYETYSGENFDTALSFLTRTLGDDLALDTPSMDKKHLTSVNTSLGQVRLLQSAHALCHNLLERWKNVHNVRSCPLETMSFLKQFVGLRSEKYLGAIHIERIAAQAKAPDIEHEVLFLQEMLRMARNIPSELFDGTQGRMRLLDAVQSAVDNAIDREDAYLASLGE